MPEPLKSRYYLLGVETDTKTSKGTKFGYLTGIMYLAPAKESGKEACPSRSKGCTAACLFTAGRGQYDRIKDARIAKTMLLWSDRKEFLRQLRHDVARLVKQAEKKGLIPAVRLNGTSDLGWEGMARDIMLEFPNVHFYDYTKVKSRMVSYLKGKMPENYHLTFSRSESNWPDCSEILKAGGNVAVVFNKHLPESYEGYSVFPGDNSDLRFKDPQNVIVGLTSKGRGKKDTSGFVIYA